MTLLLKLRFMRLMCDFMLDWYYFRKIHEEPKKRKMENINAVREDIVEAIKVEQSERGI